MKKIALLSLLSLLIVNKVFSAWVITGPTNVCANNNGCSSPYTYTLKGFPEGSINHSYAVPASMGGTLCNKNGDTFTMYWYNDCSSANTSIIIANISWSEKNGDEWVYKTYTEQVSLSVNVAKLGTIATPAWNVTPYACSSPYIVYSIAPVCGATFYSWSIPPGWSVDPTTPLSGANANSVILYPTFTTGGTLSVNVINSNNGCNLSKSYSATITRPVQPPVFTTTKTNYCLSSSPSAQFCVSAVPNAASYSWTYPSGWTGPATTTTPCATVNFNGQIKTGNICCQTNANCGGTSAPTCLTVTATNSPPPLGISFFTIQTFATSIPSKKNVAINFADLGFPYTWTCYKFDAGGTSQFSGVGGQSTSILMTNGEMFQISATATNDCGTTQPELQYGYKLVNGVLKTYPLARTTSINNEDSFHAFENKDFKIFPNPASSIITISLNDLDAKNYSISIYDLLGKKVIEANNIATNSTEINVSALENGIYFLQVEEDNSIIRKEKIVITH